MFKLFMMKKQMFSILLFLTQWLINTIPINYLKNKTKLITKMFLKKLTTVCILKVL